MELSSREILERMEKYVQSAGKVKELKDYLLTFRFLGDNKEWLEEELARHDEAIEEVGRIYREEMLPLIEEMAEYLSAHKEDLEKLIQAA
ncbi:MAG: hypothetical protein V2A78_06645 [bacterium]